MNVALPTHFQSSPRTLPFLHCVSLSSFCFSVYPFLSPNVYRRYPERTGFLKLSSVSDSIETTQQHSEMCLFSFHFFFFLPCAVPALAAEQPKAGYRQKTLRDTPLYIFLMGTDSLHTHTNKYNLKERIFTITPLPY